MFNKFNIFFVAFKVFAAEDDKLGFCADFKFSHPVFTLQSTQQRDAGNQENNSAVINLSMIFQILHENQSQHE